VKRLILAIAIIFIIVLIVACEPTTPESPSNGTTTSTAVTTAPTTSIPVQGPVGGSESIVVRPSGSDDTKAFIKAVETYKNITVSGNLLINEVALIKNVSNKRILFQQNSSLTRTVRPEKRVWQVLFFENSTNITIDNLQIKGPNIQVCDWTWIPPKPTSPLDLTSQTPRVIQAGYSPSYEAQHGLEIRGGKNIVVNSGRIFGMSGDGIYLDKAVNQTYPEYVSFNNLTVECTGRSSISNVGSLNTTISGGTYKKSGLWIFNIEPYNGNKVYDYNVSNVTVGFSNWQWLMASGPYFSCDIGRITFSGLTFVNAYTGPPKYTACSAKAITIK